jgi:predicted DNA-binding ribbon-helix-helix protein
LKKLNYEGKRTNVSLEYVFWQLLAICYSGDISTSIYRLIFMSDIN